LSLRQERETFSETAVSRAREFTGLGIKTAFRARYGRFGIPMLTFCTYPESTPKRPARRAFYAQSLLRALYPAQGLDAGKLGFTSRARLAPPERSCEAAATTSRSRRPLPPPLPTFPTQQYPLLERKIKHDAPANIFSPYIYFAPVR